MYSRLSGQLPSKLLRRSAPVTLLIFYRYNYHNLQLIKEQLKTKRKSYTCETAGARKKSGYQVLSGYNVALFRYSGVGGVLVADSQSEASKHAPGQSERRSEVRWEAGVVDTKIMIQKRDAR